ncbi:LuxR family transcriptional regulator [Kribbella capetownensis]|uniref:LuxR family transcriptional regulator n=1 Tax=Kribbella capetownensis TaxID=1572659 RepID=A0A4R0JLP3_9ACTN|nr:LuxR family transcriptional regulator [Kribbella capetownensis]TCC42805.1 LuxR family transcriptional regulator [Kribbella capetownensis]
MVLLERDSALEALTQYAAQARAGEGRVVLISGEAGAGKTALLEQLRRDLADVSWVGGTCDGLITPRPLGPLFEIAEQLEGELLQACRSERGRDELFTVLLRCLSAPGPPVVVAIEDLHWADESTLDLVRFLGRRIRTTRSLLLVTFRDDALGSDEALRIALGGLAGERATRRVTVPVLSADAVAVLAAGSGLAPADVYRLSGGNAFFVHEIVRSASELPASARDAVLARVARLSVPARAVLDVAAVAGLRVELGLLEAVGTTARDLDELVVAGALISEGSSLRFRHEINRRAVASEIPGYRQAAIHAQLLAALLRSGGADEAVLAFHAAGAGDRDSVVRYAPAAGRRAAALGAHREAVEHFEAAVRFAGHVTPRTAADLWSWLATEASVVERWQLALDAGRRALELWREVGDPPRESAEMRSLSSTMWRLCRGRESMELAVAAVDVIRDRGATPELARAYGHLAQLQSHYGEIEAATSSLRQAGGLVDMLDLPDVRSDLANTAAVVAWTSGEEWMPLLDRALEIALDLGAREPTARAYANLCTALCDFNRFAEAESYYARGAAFCDEAGMVRFGLSLRATWGEILLGVGRWDEAVEVCRQVLASGASPFNRLSAAIVIGRILARRDDGDPWPYLDEAVASADATGRPDLVGLTRSARAEAHWLVGDRDAALQDVTVASVHADRAHEWIQGQIATWQTRLDAVVTPSPARLPEPHARSASRDFDRAAELWDGIGSPFDAALALLDSGSEAGMREALRRFDTLGAVAAARLTRRRMRRLGLRAIPSGAHPSTRSDAAGMTRREREVMTLVAAGQSNAAIAAHLVISTRTVEHHVAAVLTKLGVGSRTLVAAEAGRRGLLDAPDRPGAASTPDAAGN